MSRHRQVRNDLKYEEFEDEDDYEYDEEYDDDYQEEEVGPTPVAYSIPTSKPVVAPPTAPATAKFNGSDYSKGEILDALSRYNGDVERAVNFLFENPPKGSATPMELDDESTPSVTSGAPLSSSLQHLLQPIKRNDNAATGIPSRPNANANPADAVNTKPSLSTLLSGGSIPTGKPSLSSGSLGTTAKSSLSSLSSGGLLKTPLSQGTSNAGLKPSLSSLGGLGGLSALSNMGSPGLGKASLGSISSGASLKSLSTSTGMGNVTIGENVSSQDLIQQALSAISSPGQPKASPALKPTGLNSLNPPFPRATTNQPEKTFVGIQKPVSKHGPKLDFGALNAKSGESQFTDDTLHRANPLLAAPSTFADFWTEEKIIKLPNHNQINAKAQVAAIIPNAESLSSVDVKPFNFTSPSPDDIVLAARSGKSQVKVAETKQEKPKSAVASTTAEKAKLSQAEPAKPKVEAATASQPPSTPLESQLAELKVSSSSKAKKIDVRAEYTKRNAEKENLNLVVVGHVDAGKSTMMGHLLFLLGEVNDRTMKKYERDAEKMKKGSFAFAWVLDETEEERSRGVTIDVAINKFETPHRKFVLLDAPGHRDFVPNMISGASQADVAVLVVDSSTGEFESGFSNGGQTREHSLLVRSLGVSQLIVAINKLDTVDWSQSRYTDIMQQLLNFLVTAGFKAEKLTFIPCSGFSGENLLKAKSPELLSWYTGPTLVEALDTLQPPVRPIEKPFRLMVADFFKGGMGNGGSADLTVSGRIESGSVQIGDAVLMMPIGEIGSVRGIEVASEVVKWSVAGDNVTIAINGVDVQHVRARIITFDIEIPLTIGVPVVLHSQSAHESASICKLISILNKSTGEVIKKSPRALTKNMSAMVEVKLVRPMCLETSKDSKDLGRFMLRSKSEVVAAGIITDILARVK
ncbi:HBS1-like protein [Blyttiomyces sp. JEL0837]|nr:HBS1-like protein [Blyttiomyces sp. JEL0837]